MRKNRNIGRFLVCLICVFCTACPSYSADTPLNQSSPSPLLLPYVRYSEPKYLTFDELKLLSEKKRTSGPLEEKLNKLWTTPIISNEAYYRGARAPERKDSRLGHFVRLASWNIEKSIEIPRVITAITDASAYQEMINPKKAKPGSKKFKESLMERDRLSGADILVLQEMDIGVKRSDYRNAPKQLAEALNMNYAYGAAYLEIDPAYLGAEKIDFQGGQADVEAMEYYRADPERYKGLFGSAVLSRYPIKNVIVFPLKTQGYDWYQNEKNKTTFLEETRRFGAKNVFKNEVHREVKVGNRIFMRVDLEVPGIPKNTLTIINIHLEIKCEPRWREAQIKEILGYIKDIDNPLVMIGDFNSAPDDLTPTSISREVKRALRNPTNWLTGAVTVVFPFSYAINAARGMVNTIKNFQNPTATSIPILASNSVRGLFNAIENFRFKDGSVFDFRGDRKRSINRKKGLLANSNQRDFKAYKTTFQVRRPLTRFIGKYRLDWVFVKGFLRDPHDKNGSYRFAPHFGATLEEMNTVVTPNFSDHHPNTVDIPFEEPHF